MTKRKTLAMTEKMNILFLTKELPYPPNNGHKIRTYNLIKGLSRNNRIDLICSQTENSALSGWKLYWSAALGLFSPLPFAIKRRYSPLMKEEIDQFLEKNNVDLIFCDSLYQAPYICLNGHNKVLCEHNIESTIVYRYFSLERNILKKLYALIEFLKMRRYENKMWGIFNCCLAVSEKDKEIIDSRIKKTNTEVVPNGVDVNYFYPRDIKVKPFSLIYTGQMNWYPNDDAVFYFLTDVYPLIKKEIPRVSFWIVGKEPSERIKRLAGKDTSIIMTGFVDDVRPYLASAEIVVAPLRIGSGTRLKILEAMAMEKPVVSTNVGCEGLEVADGENILIASEPGDFAQKVIEIFKNPALVKRLGTAGRRLVEEKYSWDKIITDLDGAIKDV